MHEIISSQALLYKKGPLEVGKKYTPRRQEVLGHEKGKKYRRNNGTGRVNITLPHRVCFYAIPIIHGCIIKFLN
jgi:hypothetical protein